MALTFTELTARVAGAGANGEYRFRHVVQVSVADPDHESDPDGARRNSEQIARILEMVDERRPVRGEADADLVAAFSGDSPGLQRWSSLMPSAAALWPLYNPSSRKLHDGFDLDEIAEGFFRHSLDARGIRSRGAVTQRLLRDHLADRSVDRSIRWASLACGAAEAVCPVVADARRSGIDVVVDLVDKDGFALDLCLRTARRTGCDEAVSTRQMDILQLGPLVENLGEGEFDLVDILGFFEYLPTSAPDRWVNASQFLSAAYSLLAPGGQLIMANMLESHPQLPMTIHSVCWPYIQPRTLDELADIIDTAGISSEGVDVYMPDDGVYAVLSITKPVDGEGLVEA